MIIRIKEMRERKTKKIEANVAPILLIYIFILLMEELCVSFHLLFSNRYKRYLEVHFSVVQIAALRY